MIVDTSLALRAPGEIIRLRPPDPELERELSSLSSKIHEDARRSLNSWGFNGVIKKFRIVEPEDKVVARNNLQSCFASEITMNPAYLVEDIDYNIGGIVYSSHRLKLY